MLPAQRAAVLSFLDVGQEGANKHQLNGPGQATDMHPLPMQSTVANPLWLSTVDQGRHGEQIRALQMSWPIHIPACPVDNGKPLQA